MLPFPITELRLQIDNFLKIIDHFRIYHKDPAALLPHRMAITATSKSSVI